MPSQTTSSTTEQKLSITPVKPSERPDDKANFEEAAFASGANLEDAKTERRISALKHEGSLEGHVFTLVKWFMTFIFILLAIALIVICFHMLAPASMRWLTTEEVMEIRNFLFSGAAGAALAFVARFVFRQSENS